MTLHSPYAITDGTSTGEPDAAQTIRAYVDAFNRGDMAALRAVFTDDALVYGALGWGGLDEIVPVWRMLHDAFAFQLEVEGLMTQGDTVVVRFRERGTSVGPFRGQAPTGATSEVLAIEWFELDGGRIRRRWGARDSAAHFRQMGLAAG